MVSPQPCETLVSQSSSHHLHSSSHSSTKQAPPLVTAPAQAWKPNTPRAYAQINAHHQQQQRVHHQAGQHVNAAAPTHAQPAYANLPRLKRTTSFIPSETGPQPYLWALYDELPTNSNTSTQSGDIDMASLSLTPSSSPSAEELFLADLPPMQYAFGEDLGHYKGLAPYELGKPQPCDQCWQQNGQCLDCAHHYEKQSQFENGWPVESRFDGQQNYLQSEYAAFPHDTWIKQEPLDSVPLVQEPIPYDEVEEKDCVMDLPPLQEPLLTGADHLARVQGKLTRFLPEGEAMMAVDHVDPNYTTAFEHQASSVHQHEHAGRTMRVRKPRSRSPSPDFSERSGSPDSFASSVETDSYEHDDRAMLDDTLSPPVVRYDDSGSSGQSSSEPPALVSLLPVSARDLVPSRPSTAAVPPAHIKVSTSSNRKPSAHRRRRRAALLRTHMSHDSRLSRPLPRSQDRLVKSAKKLLTAADGVNDSVQVQVIPTWFPSKGAQGAHKIRLIRVENTEEGSVSVYAHAADVGGVVERKSNISRLFGKFESPSEKLLMNVVGAHNNVVGQESNILTSKGVKKFLATNKMRDAVTYRQWIQSVLLPQLLHDPLEIGEELLEIEASTNPHMPHHIKPKKMKRMEKKQQRKAQEKQDEEEERKKNLLAIAQKQLNKSTSPPAPIIPSHLGSADPSPKRQKLSHTPVPAQLFSPPFNGTAGPASSSPFRFTPLNSPFALNNGA
jgi:hypothetical protein